MTTKPLAVGTNVDHYHTLGCQPEATAEELRAAYRDGCRLFHPDLNPNMPAAEAHREMVALNAAWEVLGDPVKRRAYDFERARHREPTPIRPPTYRPSWPIWSRARTGNVWTKYQGVNATVFMHRKGRNVGRWGYVVDDVFGPRTYDCEWDARAAAEDELDRVTGPRWRRYG